MADTRDDAPPRPEFRTAAARFVNSALALAHTRVELAAVELAEERERLKRSAVLIAGAVSSTTFKFGFFQTVIKQPASSWPAYCRNACRCLIGAHGTKGGFVRLQIGFPAVSLGPRVGHSIARPG